MIEYKNAKESLKRKDDELRSELSQFLSPSCNYSRSGNNISNLPVEKKQKILLFIYDRGEGKKEPVVYDIIRIRPEDDDSKILSFEKIAKCRSFVKWQN